MNVFIIGTPYETAQALDSRRLNKQIIECQQILNAIDGAKGWNNHPCVLQYKEHKRWLSLYFGCLSRYRDGKICMAKEYSKLSEQEMPFFHVVEYFDHMKRRLYTKDPVHYAQWAHLGTSDVNWYYVEGEWRYYQNSKRITL